VIDPSKPPDAVLAENIRAAAWTDPCLQVDFSDFEEHYLAPARAKREAEAARQNLNPCDNRT